MSTSPSALASAIASAEGYGVGGAIPTTHNNPGDLTNSSGSIISFPDASSGWSALENQVTKMTTGTSKVYSPSMTIAQAGQTYANGDTSWAANVAAKLGVPVTSTLGSLLNSSISGAPGVGTVAMSALSSMHSSAIGPYLEDAVFVIVGLLLIAAAIFSFNGSRNVIQTIGKSASEVVA